MSENSAAEKLSGLNIKEKKTWGEQEKRRDKKEEGEKTIIFRQTLQQQSASPGSTGSDQGSGQ